MPYFSDSYCENWANLSWDLEIYHVILKANQRDFSPKIFNIITVNMETVQTGTNEQFCYHQNIN